MNIVAPLMLFTGTSTTRHPGSFWDRLTIAGQERAKTGGHILIPVPDNEVWARHAESCLRILHKHHCVREEITTTLTGPSLKDQILATARVAKDIEAKITFVAVAHHWPQVRWHTMKNKIKAGCRLALDVPEFMLIR